MHEMMIENLERIVRSNIDTRDLFSGAQEKFFRAHILLANLYSDNMKPELARKNIYCAENIFSTYLVENAIAIRESTFVAYNNALKKINILCSNPLIDPCDPTYCE